MFFNSRIEEMVSKENFASILAMESFFSIIVNWDYVLVHLDPNKRSFTKDSALLEKFGFTLEPSDSSADKTVKFKKR